MGNLIDNTAVPAEMSYNPGFLIGIHVGKHHPKFKYYLDYNLADINVTGTSQVLMPFTTLVMLILHLL